MSGTVTVSVIIEKQPVKQPTMTVTLSDGGETTLYTMSYDYELKGGPLGGTLAVPSPLSTRLEMTVPEHAVRAA